MLYAQYTSRSNVFSRWLDGLANGDPIAIGALVVFLVFIAFVGAVAFYAKRKVDREDAAAKNKWKKK